jgi:O-antigen biosynthesis protein
MNRPYLVAAPPFDPSNGGAMVLHKFAQALEEAGQDVYLIESNNPSYTYTNVPKLENSIGVYPEITWGNPLNTKTVIRWILNTPGKIRGPLEYPETDILFSFSELFNVFNLPKDRILFFPILDTELFKDEKQPRTEVTFYVGKGWRSSFLSETAQAKEISKYENQTGLKDILNKSKIMYCYDNITAMTEIARLCGSPVIIIPNGEFTKEQYNNHEFGWNGLGWGEMPESFDSKKFRETYLEVRETFYKKLDGFIELTQKA